MNMPFLKLLMMECVSGEIIGKIVGFLPMKYLKVALMISQKIQSAIVLARPDDVLCFGPMYLIYKHDLYAAAIGCGRVFVHGQFAQFGVDDAKKLAQKYLDFIDAESYEECDEMLEIMTGSCGDCKCILANINYLADMRCALVKQLAFEKLISFCVEDEHFGLLIMSIELGHCPTKYCIQEWSNDEQRGLLMAAFRTKKNRVIHQTEFDLSDN